MSFFLDANLPTSAKETFAKYGKVWHAGDVNLGTAPDDKIFDFAIRNKAILVTKDLGFGLRGKLKKNHPGIIIVRVPHYFKTRQINDFLGDFLGSIRLENIKGAITVIRPGKTRVRKI